MKPTETKVRYADGSEFIQRTTGEVEQSGMTQFGFVVDTKPDKIPAEIIKNELFLGSQDCADLEVLGQYGINAVLSVGIECPIELLPKDDFKCKFLNCLDLPETDFRPVLKEGILFIDECLEENRVVLVHCNAGVSRSSAIILGYLVQVCKMPLEEAYRVVKAKRPSIQPNAGFMAFLKTL